MDDADKVRLIGRALQLAEREEGLRERARDLELVPGLRIEAEDLFRQASEVRQERMQILERCGLA